MIFWKLVNVHSTIPGYLSSIYVQILDNPPYYILCTSTTVARLIYDQTSSNSRNYTAQGVGNNSCCKTLPISADDDDERAETVREEEERERKRGMNLLSTYMYILSRIS